MIRLILTMLCVGLSASAMAQSQLTTPIALGGDVFIDVPREKCQARNEDGEKPGFALSTTKINCGGVSLSITSYRPTKRADSEKEADATILAIIKSADDKLRTTSEFFSLSHGDFQGGYRTLTSVTDLEELKLGYPGASKHVVLVRIANSTTGLYATIGTHALDDDFTVVIQAFKNMYFKKS
ncbi:MAG: hypothetical protein QM776_01145 [Rhodocyclaceae bacterium]